MYEFAPISERIAALREKKEKADSAGYHLESERTRIYTQYYRDHEEEHPVLKRARALYAWC